MEREPAKKRPCLQAPQATVTKERGKRKNTASTRAHDKAILEPLNGPGRPGDMDTPKNRNRT